jgi:hypothetical protein
MNFLQTIFMRAVDRPKGILGRLEVYLCKITETVRKNARVHTPRALTVPQGLGGSRGGRRPRGHAINAPLDSPVPAAKTIARRYRSVGR